MKLSTVSSTDVDSRAGVNERAHRILSTVDPSTVAARFAAKVDQAGMIPAHRPELGPCWEWTGRREPGGYGRFSVGGRPPSGDMLSAHAVALWLETGRPPTPGMHADHLCRNHGCVRASHLEEVTPAENARRGEAGAVNAARQRAVTECPAGHPYDAGNTAIRRSGARRCKTCERDRARSRRSTR